MVGLNSTNTWFVYILHNHAFWKTVILKSFTWFFKQIFHVQYNAKNKTFHIFTNLQEKHFILCDTSISLQYFKIFN